MSVIGSSSSSSSALGALTNPQAGQVQQRIAAKVLQDELESEAAMALKLVDASRESSPSTLGSRIDARA